MNTRNHTILLSFVGSALLALTACNAQVVGGGDTGTGGAGAASTTVATGNGGAGNQGGGGDGGGVAGGNPGSNAIAMLYSELPVPGTDPNPTGSGVSVTSTGGGPSGDTLYIAISDMAQQCEDPYGNYPCGNHWKVMLGIPVELQKVGVIQLNDPSIIANAFSTGQGTDPECPAGGGSFWDGTLEITEIDDTHVAGVLTDTMKFDFDADGPFDALRCTF